jgi:hypothetical protein
MTAEEQNGRDNRYRKLVEHEAAAMDDFATRLGNQEVVSASIKSDVRGLFGVVNSISDKLDTMQQQSRPNTMALFGAAFAAVSLIMGIGVLAFSPVWKTLDSITEADQRRQVLIESIISTRYTPDDARQVQAEHDEDVFKLEKQLSDRLYRNETELIQITKEVSYIKGKFATPMNVEKQ